jgi:hypothetical protein
LYINLVIMPMGSDESDVDHSIDIVDPYDQSKLIPCNRPAGSGSLKRINKLVILVAKVGSADALIF